jgi:hypothetical protein
MTYTLRVRCQLAIQCEGGWKLGDASVVTEPPAGAMWLSTASYCDYPNQPCQHLLIALPNGECWDVDEHAGGSRRIWIRRGEPPNVSVFGDCRGGPGSIGVQRNGGWVYHAFLWNGELIEIERARNPAEFALLTSDQQNMLSERLPLSFPPPTGALGEKVTLVLRMPNEKVTGELKGVSAGMIRLDAEEYPVSRYVRVYGAIDWWERDVETL